MKELALEPYSDTSILNSVAANLDNLDMAKVKTKYAKTGWDAISLHGYGPEPTDILKPGVLNYTSKTVLKQIYNVINTLIIPDTGELRVRSDRAKLNIDEKKKVPNWKYAKKVYFGLTPYHMHAGVTASNYKYHKRKAGSSCKKSMNLESANAVENLDDVRQIRETMIESDNHLRDLWRTARKMIVEDGLR